MPTTKNSRLVADKSIPSQKQWYTNLWSTINFRLSITGPRVCWKVTNFWRGTVRRSTIDEGKNIFREWGWSRWPGGSRNRRETISLGRWGRRKRWGGLPFYRRSGPKRWENRQTSLGMRVWLFYLSVGWENYWKITWKCVSLCVTGTMLPTWGAPFRASKSITTPKYKNRSLITCCCCKRS